MSRPVISVENLSKAYRIGLKEEVPDTLTSALIGFAKAPFRKFQELRRLDTFRHTGEAEDIVWALKDVSFEVQEGEVLGVIGRNGAGKSTLLKILSRIAEPTSGRAVIRGRVSSLLEVGTGFHPELSGRENVYLNGTILGMTKAEIDKKFDEIVDFSGVEKFLDTPIKRYSSGMKVRLAFAVAAHLEPEILIIDEVLAVGDAEFQKKCMGKMQEVARCGRTVIFVSHNFLAVKMLCDRCVWLVGGKVQDDGPVEQTVKGYLGTLNAGHRLPLDQRTERGGTGVARVNKLLLNGLEGDVFVGCGQSLDIELFLSRRLENGKAVVAVYDSDGAIVVDFDGRLPSPQDRHVGYVQRFKCQIPNLPLVPDEYSINFALFSQDEMVDQLTSAAHVTVLEDNYGCRRVTMNNRGFFAADYRWESFES